MIRRVISSVLHNKLIIKSTKYFCTMEQPNNIIYVDWKTATYGDYPIIKSTFRSDRKWVEVPNINQALDGQQILVRARVHNTRSKGNNCFIVLRQGFATVQACAFTSETTPKQMIKYMADIPNESIVDLYGKVQIPQKPIQSCSQKVQISITKCLVVNRAESRLPLQIIDASRKVLHNEFDPNEEEQQVKKQEPKKQEVKQVVAQQPKVQGAQQTKGEQGKQEKKKKEKKQKKQKKQKKEEGKKEQKQAIVKMKTRLDNRVIDLRTTAKHAIFRLQSGVCQIFREFLLNQDFVEIHTPKLIGGSSQGGSNVFNFTYFGRKACLAQSPQLYKQMCVMGDFQKVFQIGPVFRAQNSFTHRHMCQFVGLDLEMAIKQHYYELLDFFGELFPYLFQHLANRFARELKAINQQFEFEPFVCKKPYLKLTFEQGIQLLKQNGVQWPHDQDLSTEVQRKLGQFVKAKYQTDFYMLHRYPVSARPFYTMLCEDDPNYTCSYDFFMRGEEILSGAQRIHDPILLKQRAIAKGIDPQTIKDYIECFKYGAYPHGGGGIGLERVVMLFCGLKNIRNASLFPRDPKRITP